MWEELKTNFVLIKIRFSNFIPPQRFHGWSGLLLTKTDEEGGHRLVLGHVDHPSAQAEMWENQQHLLHNIVDAGDVLLGRKQRKTSAYV